MSKSVKQVSVSKVTINKGPKKEIRIEKIVKKTVVEKKSIKQPKKSTPAKKTSTAKFSISVQT
jgi:hypothetical protein